MKNDQLVSCELIIKSPGGRSLTEVRCDVLALPLDNTNSTVTQLQESQMKVKLFTDRKTENYYKTIKETQNYKSINQSHFLDFNKGDWRWVLSECII